MNTNQDKVNNIIKELIVELKAKYSDFRGIYLFGSYARGEATEDSDIDLAVIFDNDIDWKIKNQIRKTINRRSIFYDVIIDNPMYRIEDIVSPKTFFRKKINEEGIFYEC